MKTTRDLARGLITRYETLTHSNFGGSELKLHIMMYFVQRQSLAYTGNSIINEPFVGWIHGPGLESLRFILEESPPTKAPVLTENELFIIDGVIHDYGKYSAWELKKLVIHEVSWVNSRHSLHDDEAGSIHLTNEDISKDAVGIRIYDSLFDMYIDEFDDIDREVIQT